MECQMCGRAADQFDENVAVIEANVRCAIECTAIEAIPAMVKVMLCVCRVRVERTRPSERFFFLSAAAGAVSDDPVCCYCRPALPRTLCAPLAPPQSLV